MTITELCALQLEDWSSDPESALETLRYLIRNGHQVPEEALPFLDAMFSDYANAHKQKLRSIKTAGKRQYIAMRTGELHAYGNSISQSIATAASELNVSESHVKQMAYCDHIEERLQGEQYGYAEKSMKEQGIDFPDFSEGTSNR